MVKWQKFPKTSKCGFIKSSNWAILEHFPKFTIKEASWQFFDPVFKIFRVGCWGMYPTRFWFKGFYHGHFGKNWEKSGQMDSGIKYFMASWTKEDAFSVNNIYLLKIVQFLFYLKLISLYNFYRNMELIK